MDRIITFDICSVITLLVLLLSLFLRKLTRGKSNVLYILLITMVLLSGIFDILRVYMPLKLSHTRAAQIQVYVYNYLYFITRNLSTPIYILFIFSVCGMWHDFNKDILLKITWGVPVFAVLAIIVMNLFLVLLLILKD